MDAGRVLARGQSVRVSRRVGGAMFCFPFCFLFSVFLSFTWRDTPNLSTEKSWAGGVRPVRASRALFPEQNHLPSSLIPHPPPSLPPSLPHSHTTPTASSSSPSSSRAPSSSPTSPSRCTPSTCSPRRSTRGPCRPTGSGGPCRPRARASWSRAGSGAVGGGSCGRFRSVLVLVPVPVLEGRRGEGSMRCLLRWRRGVGGKERKGYQAEGKNEDSC